ncbi:diphthine--ammonia ligase-like [Branchiostoma floridae]|uniref:Diphthine--ammonia ligase n=2 Tax=Branchiostoma floridae TaxID=7739 RepID=A0A9J7L2T3_BRAFL|nr:diphthine--ammonia ligase-like [Branchiostoma floridae]
MRVVALISGGKDSCYNMMQCVAEGHQIVALANLRPQGKDELDSYMFQTVGHDAIDLYAEAMSLPLFRRTIQGGSVQVGMDYTPTDADEVEDLFLLLQEIKEEVEIEAVSVGAILSDYQRVRVENVCSRLGLTSLGYLWRRDQQELLQEMIDSQVHAILIKVAALGLDPDKHLGLTLQQIYPHMLKMNEKYGLNICGEGGEYETFTLDCPLFRKKIVIDCSEKVVHSADPFAPVAYLKFPKMHLEEKIQENPGEISSSLTGVSIRTGEVMVQQAISAVKLHVDITRRNQQETTCTRLRPSNKRGVPMQDIVTLKKTHGAYTWLSVAVYKPQDINNKRTTEDTAQVAMDTIKDTLAGSGLCMADIAHVQLYVADMAEFGKVNSRYKQYFSINPPSRVCVEGAFHASGKLVQLDCCVWRQQTGGGERRTMHVQGLSHWAPANIGPYSQASQVDQTLFLAGQIPLCPSTMLIVEGGIIPQTRLSLSHVQRVMSAMCTGASLINSRLVICYVTNISYIQIAKAAWEQNTQVMDDIQQDDIRSGVETYVVVPALPRGALVEWHVTATADPSSWEEKRSLCSAGGTEVTLDCCYSTERRTAAVKISLGLPCTSQEECISLEGVIPTLVHELSGLLSVCGLELQDVLVVRIFYLPEVAEEQWLQTVMEGALNQDGRGAPALAFVPVSALEPGQVLAACCWVQGLLDHWTRES